MSNTNCTHFVWFDKKCHLKSGLIGKNMSVLKYGSICGLVSHLLGNFTWGYI